MTTTTTHPTGCPCVGCECERRGITREQYRAEVRRGDAPTAPPEHPATEKQVSYLLSLLAGRVLPDGFEVQPEEFYRNLSKRAASALIDTLVALPYKPRQTEPQVEVPEGIHRLFDESNDIVVYKVQRAVHGSGNLYAKRLVLHLSPVERTEWRDGAPLVIREHPDPEWVYEGRAPLRNLNEGTLLSLTEAKQYGVLYGVCMICGRLLTDETSIAQGIGPVCAKRFS